MNIVKQFLKNLIWHHILMPRSKFECIGTQREIVDVLRIRESVYRKLFDEAYHNEKREAHVLRLRVVIALSLGAIALMVFGCIRWGVPNLIKLKIFSFLGWIFFTLLICGYFLAVIRSRLEIINVAFLGAEASATEKFKELREAEAASRKVGQAKPIQAFKPGTVLPEDYIPVSLKRKAGEEPKKPKKPKKAKKNK